MNLQVNGYVTVHYDAGNGVSSMGGKVGKYVSDGAYHRLFLSSNGSGHVVLRVDAASEQLLTMAGKQRSYRALDLNLLVSYDMKEKANGLSENN